MCYTLGFIFISVLLIGLSQSFFHKPSMKSFQPPSMESDSLFGYSVAYQSASKSLVVGAPRADDVGQIFTVDVRNANISRVPITLSRVHKNITNDFLLGAAVQASSNFFVIRGRSIVLWCVAFDDSNFKLMSIRMFVRHDTQIWYFIQHTDVLPSWTKVGMPLCCNYPSNQNTARLLHEPVGKIPSSRGVCFISVVNAGTRQLPLINDYERRFNAKTFDHQMDSFGWSIDITKKQYTEVLVGAPALFRGRVALYTSPLSNKRPNLIYKTKQDDPVSLNYGYSLASGQYFSKDTVYAISTTYGVIGIGKVYFFDSQLKNIGSVVDDDVGNMFGAALCSAHLGKPALLVGAPVYADDAYKYDIGAVFVYLVADTTSEQMTLKRKIVGISNGGYFGSAIATLGDLDGDAKDEIAIGAPYDDDGKGAVYIYSGSGILEGKEYLEKIQPEGFRAFGFTLTVLNDFDENGCNELAVGSPKTNEVVLFRSIASVTVSLRTVFPNLQNRQDKTYFEFLNCIDVKYPKKPKDIIADLNVKIETFNAVSKLKEADENGIFIYNVTLNDKQPTYCRKIGVVTQVTTGDYTQMIAYKITAELMNSPENMTEFDSQRVSLSENSVVSLQGDEWASDCGDGRSRCVPQLIPKLSSSLITPYLIGSSESEQISLSILNKGETAYDACVLVDVLGSHIMRPPPGCTRVPRSDKITCKPSRPLVKDDTWDINNITIETKSLTSKNDKLTIDYDVYNHCNEDADKNNYLQDYVLKGDNMMFTIKSQSIPDNIMNVSANLNNVFQHMFTINNNGLTNWIGVQSEIILEKTAFIQYSETPIIVISETSTTECAIQNDTQAQDPISVLCDIGDLPRNSKTTVSVTIEIPANTLESEDKYNVTISTTFNLLLNEEKKTSSVSTVVVVQSATVPLWIIIVASLFALLLVAIIAFALYECGFFQRQHKTELKKVKEEVRRESVRRSTIRESMRAAARRSGGSQSIRQDNIPLTSQQDIITELEERNERTKQE